MHHIIIIIPIKVDGGVVDLSLTGTTTYQLGLIASADSMSRDEDVLRPADVRLFRPITQPPLMNNCQGGQGDQPVETQRRVISSLSG